MGASITLNKTMKRTNKGTVSLTLTTVGFDIPSKVFAIEVLPRSADRSAPFYRFSHVCSPAELVEFPESDGCGTCYFRTASIELIFDTDKMLSHVVDNITHDIKSLVDEYNRLDGMQGTTDTEVIE